MPTDRSTQDLLDELAQVIGAVTPRRRGETGAMFRLINVAGRAALERDGSWYDLATVADDGELADPMRAVGRHRELHDWSARCEASAPTGSVAGVALDAPVPNPSQVFAIGLNYREHASESGMAVPAQPLTFTKFPSCIAGPTAEVALSGDTVDWEVEIVVVIGDEASQVAAGDAWDVVAGLTLGQDISDRTVQLSDDPPQFSLGKSFAAYGPTGPALVSVDAFDDRDDIALWCAVDGETMQQGRTSELIFSIPTLVAHLSSICTLRPGDLIFTGTPSGVGLGRGRFLRAGETITSGAEVIGELSNRCIAGRSPAVIRPT